MRARSKPTVVELMDSLTQVFAGRGSAGVSASGRTITLTRSELLLVQDMVDMAVSRGDLTPPMFNRNGLSMSRGQRRKALRTLQGRLRRLTATDGGA